MTGTTVGIWVIVAVVVLGVAVWLTSVAIAARRPGRQRPQQDQVRGVVQGGQHVGGGRSVAPTRDAPVPEGGGEPPTAQEQNEPPTQGQDEPPTAQGQDAASTGQRPRSTGNPMDL